MSLKVTHELSRISIPKFDFFIKTSRNNIPTIWRKHDMIDRFAMSDHLSYGLFIWQLKQHQSEIIRSRNQSFSMILHSLIIQFQSLLLFIFTLISFPRLKTSSFDDMLSRQRHAINPMTMLLKLPKKTTIRIKTTYSLIFRTRIYLITSTP